MLYFRHGFRNSVAIESLLHIGVKQVIFLVKSCVHFHFSFRLKRTNCCIFLRYRISFIVQDIRFWPEFKLLIYKCEGFIRRCLCIITLVYQGNIYMNPRDLNRYYPCIYNKQLIRFIGPALSCYKIKPSTDFQLDKCSWRMFNREC